LTNNVTLTTGLPDGIFKPKIQIRIDFGGHLVYFPAIGIFCGHSVFFPVLICCTKKNLATLIVNDSAK
jgi:hypothetical protein